MEAQRSAQQQIYTSALGTEIVVDELKRRNIDPSPLLKSVGLDPLTKYGADLTVPFVAQSQLYELAAKVLANKHLGIEIARRSNFLELGPLIYLALSAKTLEHALHSLNTHISLISNSDVLTIQHEHGQVIISAVPTLELPEQFPQMEDCSAFFFVSLCRKLAGNDLMPLEVRLPYQNSGSEKVYAALFGCPVAFGHESNQVVFDQKDIGRTLRTSDPSLHQTLETHCRAMAQSNNPLEAGIVRRVKLEIAELLPMQQATTSKVAVEMGLSPRGLQRKLADHGASFQSLRDSVRRDLALNYLHNTNKSITHIAHALGYASAASFHTAFKRLTGKTPGEVGRQRNSSSG